MLGTVDRVVLQSVGVPLNSTVCSRRSVLLSGMYLRGKGVLLVLSRRHRHRIVIRIRP